MPRYSGIGRLDLDAPLGPVGLSAHGGKVWQVRPAMTVERNDDARELLQRNGAGPVARFGDDLNAP